MSPRILLRLLLLASVALATACDAPPNENSNRNNNSAALTAPPSPPTTTTNTTTNTTTGAASGTSGSAANTADTPAPAPFEGSVDAALNSMPLGEVAFNAPDKMMLGETINIEVKLGGPNLVGQLEGLIKEENVESHRVKIGKRMEAQLAGAGFEIIPVTPAEQAVSESEPTEWEWQVKAAHEGKLRLHLTLNAFVTVDGKDTRRKTQTFKKEIDVTVKPGSRIAAFFADNISWIVPVLVLPLIGGLSLRLRQMLRRRRENQ